MKWFKHLSDARKGTTLQNIYREFGLEGEARFWRFIEICSEKWDGKSEPIITFSKEILRDELKFRSWTNSLPILDLMVTDKFCKYYESGTNVVITLDKLLFIKDNHSKNLQAKNKVVSEKFPLDIDKRREENPIVPFRDRFVVSEKKEEPGKLARESLKPCIEEWRKTLIHFSKTRDPNLDELEILRAVGRYGVERVCRALAGARFEPRTEKFDPSKYVRIKRYLKPEKFDWFENLADEENKFKRETVEWK